MASQLEQISEQQKETWNKSSAGWKRWDDLMMEFLGPIGNEMIRCLAPKGNDVVLDIAAGTVSQDLRSLPCSRAEKWLAPILPKRCLR